MKGKTQSILKIDRKGLLLALLVMVFSPLMWAAPIDDFVASRGINPSQTAVLITDLNTGETLVSYHPDASLTPASIMKSVTIAGLLSQSSADRKYLTDVILTGPNMNGVIGGDILVKGSGDPSLNSQYVNGTDIIKEIVQALKDKKVNRVQGKIQIDESIWTGPAVCPTWGKGDLSQAYGTGQHGLNFEDNSAGRSSVANPAAVFKSRLQRALAAEGIVLENGNVEGGEKSLLLSHESVPMDDIMRSCMMRSDNQYAEAMLRTLSVIQGEPGSTESGALINTKLWEKKRAPMTGVHIEDGSGLSRQNRVTARFMTHVLKSMWRDPYYVSFFPLAGQEGTLRKFLKDTPLDSYIAMKTGSMNGIQCYAGYKLNDNYEPTHSVVVIMNQLVDRAAAKKSLEDMLLKIFKQ